MIVLVGDHYAVTSIGEVIGTVERVEGSLWGFFPLDGTPTTYSVPLRMALQQASKYIGDQK